MLILGISAFRTDSAAAVLKDGDIIAAASEERFTGIKRDGAFPANAVSFCLAQANATLANIESIVFFEKPLLAFERVLETYLSFAPIGLRSFQESIAVQDFRPKKTLARLLSPDKAQQKKIAKKTLFCDQHLSHAGAAFFPSPFEESVILTLDGIGEWSCSSVAIGRGSFLEIQKEMPFPHSLSFLYVAFASYLAIDPDPATAELTALASYGNPKFVKTILQNLVDVKDDGSFRLNQKYFDYILGENMTTSTFHDLFGNPPRKENTTLLQRHLDIAASAQKALEHIAATIVHALALEYPNVSNLCLAGDLAGNCGIAGRILKDGHFEHIWIPPSTGDAGAALGAALCARHLHHHKPREIFFTEDSMKGGYLGPSYSDEEIESRLKALGAKFYSHATENEMIALTAQAIADGRRVGWFQGAMEFGPHGCGGRMILSDAQQSPQKNLKTKSVESFRPVTVSILKKNLAAWFETKPDSAYAQFSAILREDRRAVVPIAASKDFALRIHTVQTRTNARFHALLREFQERTTCPLLLNEPFETITGIMAMTPEDAYVTLLAGRIDMLVIGKCILHKEEQESD